jgi:glycerol-3-phosphate dehydrogenase
MPAEAPAPPRASAPHVAVIGGGATGMGVARDLVLRGLRVTLVEHGDLGSGTSGRFHGMLQSGARYAASDPGFAAECRRERRIVAGLVPQAVEPTGGLFVSLAEDPPDFADAFKAGCAAAGMGAEELDPEAVMRDEPHISRSVQRAFSVPDATINPWCLVNALCEDVRGRGGEVLTRHRVVGIERAGGRVGGVRIANGNGSAWTEGVDAVVNAAGVWSARVAGMVDQGVDLELTKGTILVFAHRCVGRVVNRCRPATSCDIMVPSGTVGLFGTTSEVVDDPDTTAVLPAEVQALLDGAEPMIPGIHGQRALRAWAGVRPLVRPPDWPAGKPLPRRHEVIDHGELGCPGFFTVCGGSLSTHRAMAEELGDEVCRYLRLNEPCQSATTPLLGNGARGPWRPAAGHAAEEAAAGGDTRICECEAVSPADLSELIGDRGPDGLHDLRRRLRIGFGPCQGTYCAGRVAGLLAEADPGFPAGRALADFWVERLKGMTPTAWGPQARQALFSDLVFRETLGLRLDEDALPGEDKR